MILEPVADRVGDIEARAERLGLEPDADAVGGIREGLAEAWRVRLERGV